jgi:hypothetical protein
MSIEGLAIKKTAGFVSCTVAGDATTQAGRLADRDLLALKLAQARRSYIRRASPVKDISWRCY